MASPVLKDGAAVYTPGLSEKRGTASKFYHADALGSTRGVTDASQTATDATLFDAFGQVVSKTGTTPTPFGFVGASQYQTDRDSGLLLLGHRYYDPSIGRFLSQDPIQDGDNWYKYADNNPLGKTDPKGLFALVGGLLLIPGVAEVAAAVVVTVAVVVVVHEGIDAYNRWQFYHSAKDSDDEGTRPPNLTPPGAGRGGAFRKAKEELDIPKSSQPDETGPNYDRDGKVQPGRTYRWNDPSGQPSKGIRDDAGGDDYGPGDPQNRGPHFNPTRWDPIKGRWENTGGHYDY